MCFNEIGNRPVALYYSLYSLADDYRRRWMPSAMNPFTALDWIKQWADHDRIIAAKNNGIDVSTLPTLTFHWPLIKGVNDDTKTIDDIAIALRDRQFSNARFHLIAYNPPPASTTNPSLPSPGTEANDEQYRYAFDTIAKCFVDPTKSKRIQRIGFDVHASCGTFFK
jgi:adenine C2-methylase RlmN of 23S rRNA A2503 and tRNA A37